MRIKLLSLLIFIFLLPSCEKEPWDPTFPYVRVRFSIDINGLDSDLTHFSYKTFTKGRTIGEFVGYGGLLAFRSGDGHIYVYDLACPYEKNKDIRVKPNNSGHAVCPQCGSEFIVMFGEYSQSQKGGRGFGTPVEGKGPATYPLRSYWVEGPKNNGMFLVIN